MFLNCNINMPAEMFELTNPDGTRKLRLSDWNNLPKGKNVAEDLLDQWVRLITPIFPPNAWIVSQFSHDDYIIQIDWKLGDDPKRTDKRSKKIQIIIKEKIIDDYLDKNKEDRELYNILLKQIICERYSAFDADNDALTGMSTRTETWLISKKFIQRI